MMPAIALERVDFLPPERVTDDISVLTLKSLVFEPLLRWLPGGDVAPALFSEWTSSTDGREWLFTIRPHACFHDGVGCTADHVLAFIGGVLGSVDMFGMKWSYARYLAEARIEAVSERVIRVENPRSFDDIVDVFAEFYLCRRDASGAPVLGTGRYRVEQFEAEQTAALVRLRGEGPEALRFVAVPDASERLRQLRTGAVDAAHGLERIEGRLEFEPALRWHKAANTLLVMAYLNCEAGLFARPAARRAVNLAIDRPRLIAEVFDDLAIPASTIVSSFHLGMQQPMPTLDYAPEEARRLLDAAGGPGSVKLRTPTHMPERAPKVAHFIADALGALGLDVEINVEPNRPDYARQVGNKQIGDMALFDSSPQSTYRVLDDKISGRSRAVWWQGFEDAKSDALIDAALRSRGLSARARAYGDCLAHLARNPPWLYLVHPVVVLGCRPELPGLGVDHKGIISFAS
jgi:peptide/nickel transport system substrate-binding protein